MAHRSWTVEQKRAAVERMKSCGHDKLAAELKVQRRQLYAWRAQLTHIAEFLEQYYNRRRLHSALGYRSPEQFENRLRGRRGRCRQRR